MSHLKPVLIWCALCTALLLAALFLSSLGDGPKGVIVTAGLIAACLCLIGWICRKGS